MSRREKTMIRKILIANRGEIAVRVMRACQELGIASVAVYSEADRNALHVRSAGEAIRIGESPAGDSYLNIPHILQAALQSGADAVHPGYGFLSENAAFAQGVIDAGLIFIGPSPLAIHAMGDKAQARQRMQQAGVPVVPGYQGLDDLEDIRLAAGEIGYPVLIKAAMGGGGKGMRVAWQPAELGELVESARREAQNAFGDARLLLERYLPGARHIEFQVLGDQHGKLLHLYERECSLQRRHQKIIEETPSPSIDEELRLRMGAAAVAAARSVDYYNAGTVEFIFDPLRREYFFLEMNTRLQVEHPVTELVTGLDLVQWQIKIASGERLAFDQEQILQRGHAIECRLYAEDPAHDFLPASGPLITFVEPRGPGIRIDSGFTSGDELSVHYDPLIAKLVAYAEDRPAAIRRMQHALCSMVLLGITTNWQFLMDILAHPDFQAGQVHTTWIEETFGDWTPPQCEIPPEVLVAAALTQFTNPAAAGAATARPGSDPFSPWLAGNLYRPGE